MVTQQPNSNNERNRYAVQQYATAWEMGTGLRVTLPPGEYDITASEQLENVRYYLLNARYRVIAEESK